MAVRRTEKICMQVFICLVGICQIILAQIFEASNMIESMVPDAMASFYYHTEFFRVLTYVITHHKKGSLDVIFV